METVLHHHEPASGTTSLRRSKILDSTLIIGYALLIVSLAAFVFTEEAQMQPDFLELFLFHYALAAGYGILLIFNKAFGIRRSWQSANLPKTLVLMHLFLVGAYALNREIPVFDESVQWLCVYMGITSAAILVMPFYSRIPAPLKRILLFISGSALVYYFYLTLYTLPWYLFGIMGVLAIGIGGHILVPLFMFAAMILQLRDLRLSTSRKLWVIGGSAATILFVTAFCVEWVNRMETIRKAANESVLTFEDDRLPEWVRVGREVSDNWITTRALKEDLIYTTWDEVAGNNNFLSPRFMVRERHDPLVFIGTMFAKNPLTHDDRIQVLKANPDLRHPTEERLWSGETLITSFVVSDVDVYPDLHLAFTEKYLSIRDTRTIGGNAREAIYTFHLPEGSIVTSLSLWVNGVEEKAILTSKQKATTAYNTVVGVERRDPSVVHWREGNTVSVRVFPCTRDEERKFRIGFTSPLVERDGELVYRNVHFEGPSAAEAKETIRVRFIGGQIDASLRGFERQGNGSYIHNGKYDADFGFSIPAVPLRENRFTFSGHQYTIAREVPRYVPFHPDRIYLDINRAWSERDLAQVKQLIPDFDLYIIDDLPQKVNADNWDQLIRKHLKYNYSVFPFHKVKPGNLVITKGTQKSPLMHDFSESAFAKNLAAFFRQGGQIAVFDIGNENSNYVSTLRELRALRYERGTVGELTALLRSGQFRDITEDDSRIYLHDANLWITRMPVSEDSGADNAPDHSARLFAYNNIMRKAGPHYFAGDVTKQELVDEAAAAYVVSPVSSLIVLETKEDYRRFDIRAPDESLLNAKKDASGAVPEPAEWVLILIFVALVIFTVIRRLV